MIKKSLSLVNYFGSRVKINSGLWQTYCGGFYLFFHNFRNKTSAIIPAFKKKKVYLSKTPVTASEANTVPALCCLGQLHMSTTRCQENPLQLCPKMLFLTFWKCRHFSCVLPRCEAWVRHAGSRIHTLYDIWIFARAVFFNYLNN